MRLVRVILLVCVASCQFVYGIPTPIATPRYERFLEKVFAESDVDKDGRMTLTETYQWVLRLYIQINRHAPIEPPTLAQVKRIMLLVDADRSKSISGSEFRALAEIFVRRAATRVAANKVVTLLVAPLVAEACLRKIQTQVWLYDSIVVPCVPPILIPLVNPVVGRTLLIAVFVSILGGFVMDKANRFLDRQIERRESNTDEKRGK